MTDCTAEKGSQRILLTITGLHPGGAENQAKELLCSLRTLGWEVAVLSLLDGPLRRDLVAEGIPVQCLGADKYGKIQLARHAARFAGEFRPDVVLSFMFHGILLGRMLRILSPARPLVTSHRSGTLGTPSRRIIERLTGWLDSITTANSTPAATELEKLHYGRHIHIVPNMVRTQFVMEEPEPRSSIRASLQINDNTFVWINVARHDPVKGLPNLLRAFRLQLQGKPDQVLLLAGEGPERSILEQLVVDLRLDDHVRFLGRRSDIHSLLKASDAFVLSSLSEGMPNALMEALFVGVPSVSTNVGEAKRLICDDRFLAKPGNVEDLALAMARLSSAAPPELANLSRLASDRMADYAPNAIRSDWVTLLRRVTINA